MSVSVDPSSAALLSPEFLDHAEGAGLLLPNADEARMLSGERDPERAARALAGRFGEVVVTLGADGRALDRRSRRACARRRCPWRRSWTAPAPGDAFAAGLLAARLGGAAPAEALAAGARLAAEAVAQAGRAAVAARQRRRYSSGKAWVSFDRPV